MKNSLGLIFKIATMIRAAPPVAAHPQAHGAYWFAEDVALFVLGQMAMGWAREAHAANSANSSASSARNSPAKGSPCKAARGHKSGHNNSGHNNSEAGLDQSVDVDMASEVGWLSQVLLLRF